MTDTLPEVAAAEASPETKAIYEQIMTLTGVGSPALIYRHYAVFPGFLEWVWSVIGPELENGYLVREAPAVIDRMAPIEIPKITQQNLSECGLRTSDTEVLRAIFATYNRMNPVNLALNDAIRLMLGDNSNATDETKPLPPAASVPPATTMKLPAPVKLDEMDRDLQDTILDISRAIPNVNGIVIPTLYRHMAIWPDLMRQTAPAIAAAIASGAVNVQMERTKDAIAPLTHEVVGRARARDLGPAPIADPAKMVRTLDSFLITIPQLIVVGNALEHSLKKEV